MSSLSPALSRPARHATARARAIDGGIPRLYARVLAPSLLVVLLMGAVAWASVKVMGAARAYVSGESVWSKGRAQAVQHLRNYASNHDPHEYALYLDSLKAPLGDRVAREEMRKPSPDLTRTREGLLAGGNHPDDIGDMIRLIKYFGNTALFADPLQTWQRGDELIAQLQAAARTLHDRAEQGDQIGVLAALHDIDTLNEALRACELRFSAGLGRASRLTEILLLISIGSTMALLSLGSIFLIRRALHEQAAHQDALTRANRRWELAVAGSDLGLFELDLDRGRVILDARAAAIYGLPAQDMTVHRDDMSRVIVPEDWPPTLAAVRSAIETGTLFKTTLRVKGSDDQIRYVEATGRILDDDHPVRTGESRKLIGVVRDVTQEHARAQLAIERDAARRIAESQRQFLSRLSHELRTPLNAILGFAQLLAMDNQPQLAPAQQRQVKWILDAGNQLLHLVEDVLDLSKVETGEIRMQIQPCDPAAVLRACLPLVEAARQRFDITITSALGDDTPFVMADPQRLQQVFINLLSNGCKYNKPGGHLTIDAREVADTLEMRFVDDGIGLTAQDAAELFQAFRRVELVSSTVEGSGLGLYIVRQLVERMHGSVEVHSTLGQGSCFTVRLPLAP